MLPLWGQGQEDARGHQGRVRRAARRGRSAVPRMAEEAALALREAVRPGPARAAARRGAQGAADRPERTRRSSYSSRSRSFRTGRSPRRSRCSTRRCDLDPKQPDAHFVRLRLAMGEKKLDDAARILDKMVANGHDGYVLRMKAADLAEMRKDKARMKASFEAAFKFDPSQAEPLQGLYDLASEQKDVAGQLDALAAALARSISTTGACGCGCSRAARRARALGRGGQGGGERDLTSTSRTPRSTASTPKPSPGRAGRSRRSSS